MSGSIPEQPLNYKQYNNKSIKTMERKFKSHMVDVRGLSRKEAKEKRKRVYREFMLYRDLKEAYHADTGKDKCKRKVHTSRTYVKENINSI